MPWDEHWISVQDACALIVSWYERVRPSYQADVFPYSPNSRDYLRDLVLSGAVYAAGQLQHTKEKAVFVIAPPVDKYITIGGNGTRDWLTVYPPEGPANAAPILVVENLRIYGDSLIANLKDDCPPPVPQFSWPPPDLDRYFSDPRSWNDSQAEILKAARELKIIRPWDPAGNTDGAARQKVILRDETNCEEWLVGLMRDGSKKEKPKAGYWEDAKGKWSKLSKLAFGRHWAAAVRRTNAVGWSRPGRTPGRKS